MRVVVTGARDWGDEDLIREALAKLEPPVTLIHGDCRGADRLAGKIGEQLGFEVIAVPASWQVTDDTPRWAIRHYRDRAYDVRAGGLRNTTLLDMGPELVLAFHDDPGPVGGPGGTRDCMDKTLKRGIALAHTSHANGTLYYPGRPRSLFDTA